MRTLTSTNSTEVAKTVTKPFELIELTVGATTYRWSTGPTVTWNSQSWTQSGARVESLRNLAGGAMDGVISLQNTDNAASALVLADGIADAAITIYQLYGDGAYADDDAEVLFIGVCDGAPDIGLDRVKITLTTAGRAREMAPRIYWEQFCNWIPPAGTVISWNGEHYQLERRNG